jgi:hypothetical protein
MKALKFVMLLFAVVEIGFGIELVFFIDQFGAELGFPPVPVYVNFLGGLLGLTIITVAVYLIRAALNLAENLVWVRFAIAWAASGVIGAAYAIAMAYITFSQAAMTLFWDGGIALVLLYLYPRKHA